MRAQAISPVLRPVVLPVVLPVVRAVTLPPRLAGRLGGVVAGQVLGAARLLGGELWDRVNGGDSRADGQPGSAPAARPRLVEQAKGGRSAEPAPDRPMEGVAESIAEAIDDATPAGPAVAHDALPLEDYDHLTIGQLRSRIRSLSLEELGQVQAYEVAHGNRLPVLAVLTNRLRALESKAQAGAGQ